MGQGQSADTGTAGSGQEIKTSYYVLLGIEKTATEEEIKKAYRKKALELHPDRNYGNEETATKTFAEVQAAHEVLSDPQERAWYDSHESAILRGDDAATEGDAPTYENVRMTTADDLARMVRKFNSNVDFSDAPSGFFGFVRETFEQLAKEEEVAGSWEDVDVREYPSFGHKDDEYNDVVKQFYASWSGFATAKPFSWRDKYRLSEAPDRWYRRRMEQENQRLRKEGKQEFNDAVRSLVAFIRKRDPRFVPNTQSEAERQKTLRDAAAAQAARAREANAAKLAADDVPEWTKVREPDELEESEEDEIEEEVLECVACNKIFKSERQWEAHEKSKKHQKAIKDLQRRMRKQNAHLDLDGSGDVSSGVATPDALDEEQEQDILDEAALEMDDHHVNGHARNADVDIHDIRSIDPQDTRDIDDDVGDAQDAIDNDIDTAKIEESANSDDGRLSSSEDSDYASLATISARMTSATSLESSTTVDADSQPATPKLGKAAQKRAKKAAAATTAETSPQCQVCNETFPSKTKLFQHIEEAGHAALKPAGSGGKAKKSKSKR